MELHKLLGLVPSREHICELTKEAYLVGGAVRDFLMGKVPFDFDIVVNEDPIAFTKKLSSRVKGRIVPLRDEEVRFVLKGGNFLDITKGKGRIEEDLKERDLTINSLAIPLCREARLIDPFGGKRDLEKGLLRSLSKENLVKDPIRVLRVFRFKSRLSFKIEKETLHFIKEVKSHLRESAPERIRYELFLLFEGENVAETLKEMMETNVLFILFPEVIPLRETTQLGYTRLNLLEHSLTTVKFLELNIKNFEELPFSKIRYRFKSFLEDERKRALYMLGALFHDIGKPSTLSYEEGKTRFIGHEKVGERIVSEIGERLRFSNKEKKLLRKIVRFHMYPHFLAKEKEITKRALNRYLRKLDEDVFPMILLAYSDVQATPPGVIGLENYENFAFQLDEFIKEMEKVKPKRIITGYDLIEIGLTPGPIFKKILEEIDDLHKEGVIKTKEEALKHAKEIAEGRHS